MPALWIHVSSFTQGNRCVFFRPPPPLPVSVSSPSQGAVNHRRPLPNVRRMAADKARPRLTLRPVDGSAPALPTEHTHTEPDTAEQLNLINTTDDCTSARAQDHWIPHSYKHKQIKQHICWNVNFGSQRGKKINKCAFDPLGEGGIEPKVENHRRSDAIEALKKSSSFHRPSIKEPASVLWIDRLWKSAPTKQHHHHPPR